MPNTYVAINSVTFSALATSISFTSIPQTYTDLVVVLTGNMSGNGEPHITYNNDTGTNYSWGSLGGYGTSKFGTYEHNTVRNRVGGYLNYWPNSTTTVSSSVINIFGYANTATHKSVLAYDSNGGYGEVGRYVNTWYNTAAITTVTLKSFTNFQPGTTVTLYGIKAA